MELFAHSGWSRSGKVTPAQYYADHIVNVTDRVLSSVNDLAPYLGDDLFKLLRRYLRYESEFHDLGKLWAENQEILGGIGHRRRLPLNHVDAGVSYLRSDDVKELYGVLAVILAGVVVFSHHRGLPEFSDQLIREDESFRDSDLKRQIDSELPNYLRFHQSVVDSSKWDVEGCDRYAIPPASSCDFRVFLRVALSILVDADHADTARHRGENFSVISPKLDPAVRLGLLDTHVAGLAEEKSDARTCSRQGYYHACRNAADNDENIVVCDGPVGIGKTTAIMAYLLKIAAERGLRRVFVILPYTNIINQSVNVYRKSIVRAGEIPDQVVAAHHHRAEFESIESRHLTYLWDSPVVVTTAVQFFETLAACRTGALRKYHQLVGSAIFIDEVHAALPKHLWPLAWKWIQELKNNWGCYFVLGSGSLSRFWELKDFVDPPMKVHDLVNEKLRDNSLDREEERVTYRSCCESMDLITLKSWLSELDGPRLLIVNTVQSAAVIAPVSCGMGWAG